MNSGIEKALAEVTKLDSWDILSILGGVNYITQQAAINQVVRKLPEPPEEGSGLENFTAWEQAMRNPEIKQAVAPLVGIADRVKDVLNEYTDSPPTEYEKVLEFMLSRPPQRETFKAEYDNRKKLGMRPSMPMSTFVDMEYQAAMARHAHLVAKGEAAVHLLQNMDGSDGEAPEWMYESIHQKIGQKLEQRWMHAEVRRTNPKISKDKRDEAEANQTMISKVMQELGYKAPDYTEEIKLTDETDAFIDTLKAKAVK